MTNITISIVATDEKGILDECLNALYKSVNLQINLEIYVVDNANNVSELIWNKYPKVHLIINESRQGFAKNHNNVIKQSSGEFVLIMNPDVIIKEGFVESMIEAVHLNERIGVVTGKLLRPDRRTIDSTGHVIFRNRRTIDRGQGEIDRKQYAAGEIFSASGAAMLCRREMLEDIKLRNEYFDETFKLYKEDLDLCWRARLRGWMVVYVPEALAIHGRGWGLGTTRADVPRWIRRESYKNRYLLMIKNDHLSNFFKDFPFILWHEIKALIYVIFREPHLFLAWPQVIMQLPLALRKRAEIMKKAVVEAEEIRKWFI
ncbi:MAG: glycosyltransferase family 2 protein [bacterium]